MNIGQYIQQIVHTYFANGAKHISTKNVLSKIS